MPVNLDTANDAFALLDGLDGWTDGPSGKEQLPRLGWNGNISDTNPDQPGFFWIDKEDLPNCPAGWSSRRVKIGMSGVKEAWAADTISINFLNWRSRWIGYNSNKDEVYWPSRGAATPPGVRGQKSHVQILCDIYDDENNFFRCIWGMKGVSKTLPFNNTYLGKKSMYGEWPSVLHRLLDLADRAGKDLSRRIYPQLAFKVTLGTDLDNSGMPKVYTAGQKFPTTRYVYSVQDPVDTNWKDLYVGNERYIELTKWMIEEGKDWINDESFYSGVMDNNKSNKPESEPDTGSSGLTMDWDSV